MIIFINNQHTRGKYLAGFSTMRKDQDIMVDNQVT